MMVWVVVSGFFLAANSNASEPVLRGLSQIPTAAVDVVGFKPLWMGFAMAGVALVAGSSLLARKMRLQKAADSVADATPAVAPTPAPKVHVKANGAKTVRFNLNPGGARNGTNGNGHANGHAKLNGANGKKRRIFNYEKFYTEMMLQGPAPAMAEPLARFRSRESVNGHNGHNGHAASALALNG
ncbi:MAG TPA: hypothetical protein VHH88_04855, partial [Verrucomicrobiae bacterium]|nr:hypothetical protein [Verrucomicrobiae bacterium]